MGSIKGFKDLVVWEKSHKLVLNVYNLVKQFPRYEEFGLSSQIRRCAVSIPSNIAEGFKRKTKKDSLHFYNMAEASLEELKYQLFLARDLKYINPDEYKQTELSSDEVGKLLYGWINTQK